MPQDYYQILGVHRQASADEIKRAYRKLAKQFHPDVNKGNRASEERFKEITAAYDVLSDPKKRQQYDMLGQAWQGGEPTRGMEDLGELFSELFGMGGVRTGRRTYGRREPAMQRGEDIASTVDVDFLDAVHGTTVQFELRRSTGRDRIAVRIPPGVEEGQKLRVSGKGEPGALSAGDLYLTVHITPHPVFRRDGSDIIADLPITIYETILGGHVDVETPCGKAKMKVPAGTASGQKFRIKGKGAPVMGKRGVHGDFYAVIQIVPPKSIPKELKDVAERLATEAAYNPRD